MSQADGDSHGALNHYSIGYRYPGPIATKADAKAAIKECRKVCRVVRNSLSLPI